MAAAARVEKSNVTKVFVRVGGEVISDAMIRGGTKINITDIQRWVDEIRQAVGASECISIEDSEKLIPLFETLAHIHFFLEIPGQDYPIRSMEFETYLLNEFSVCLKHCGGDSALQDFALTFLVLAHNSFRFKFLITEAENGMIYQEQANNRVLVVDPDKRSAIIAENTGRLYRFIDFCAGEDVLGYLVALIVRDNWYDLIHGENPDKAVVEERMERFSRTVRGCELQTSWIAAFKMHQGAIGSALNTIPHKDLRGWVAGHIQWAAPGNRRRQALLLRRAPFFFDREARREEALRAAAGGPDADGATGGITPAPGDS